MKNPRCGVCGAPMKRNGKTAAGTQRWRCASCGASAVRKIDGSAKALAGFLSWLLGKGSASELGKSRSTFWRRTAFAWRIWPIAPRTGEVYDTVFLDGIWFGRIAVVLIASAEGRVVAWHLAQSECAEAWAALMARMPAPAMLVSDGSRGLAKAAAAVWPGTRIQRCTFHASAQVRRCTTLNPRLEAGRELLALANALPRVADAEGAAKWVGDYLAWCARWEGFLREFTLKGGERQYVHERLRKARRGLNKLVKSGQLFTFVEMGIENGGSWPSTNNAAESVNARLREMLRLHRGMPLLHRVKAVFWWCYMHTESPLPPAEILRVMPTDEDVDGLFAAARERGRRGEGTPDEIGTGIDWSEFHMPVEYRQ